MCCLWLPPVLNKCNANIIKCPVNKVKLCICHAEKKKSNTCETHNNQSGSSAFWNISIHYCVIFAFTEIACSQYTLTFYNMRYAIFIFYLLQHGMKKSPMCLYHTTSEHFLVAPLEPQYNSNYIIFILLFFMFNILVVIVMEVLSEVEFNIMSITSVYCTWQRGAVWMLCSILLYLIYEILYKSRLFNILCIQLLHFIFSKSLIPYMKI